MLLITQKLALLILCAAAVALASAQTASALTIDSSYGIAGSVRAPLPVASTQEHKVVDSVIRADGSIAVLVSNKNPDKFLIYSFTADGKTDPAFGTNGYRRGDLSEKYRAQPVGLAALSDGSLVVVGERTARHSTRTATLVAHFRRNGTQNKSFGGKPGRRLAVKIGVRGREVSSGGVAVDSSDRVIVSYVADRTRLGAVRLARSGRPDTSYGGKTPHELRFKRRNVYAAEGIAVLPDASIAIGGSLTYPCTACSPQPFIAKLNSDGSYDTGFGPLTNVPKGFQRIPVVYTSGNLSLKAAADGKLYSVINATDSFRLPNSNIAIQADGPVVRRHLSDGTIDSSLSPDTGLHDPIYPIEPSLGSEYLYYSGFDVSPDGSIATCGNDARWSNDSPNRFIGGGYVQIFDPVSIADIMIPPANLLRNYDAGNPIEDCGWQSEGKLLVVDLDRNLSVSRFHP